MVLKPENLELGFLDANNKLIQKIGLKGLKQKEGVKWVTKMLKSLKTGHSNYKIDYHYDMPEYANMLDTKFKKSPKKAFAAFSKLRTWGEHFIMKYKSTFPTASPSRTWPHHFDHATYIPLTKLKSGKVSKSISFGLAIHDGMINEPYFYISAWSKNKVMNTSGLPDLKHGYWLNDGFKGAVLPIFDVMDILNFEDQMAAIDSFFQDAIKELLNYLPYKLDK